MAPPSDARPAPEEGVPIGRMVRMLTSAGASPGAVPSWSNQSGLPDGVRVSGGLLGLSQIGPRAGQGITLSSRNDAKKVRNRSSLSTQPWKPASRALIVLETLS